jgi:ParB/RepB/Spo0J family partition protein
MSDESNKKPAKAKSEKANVALETLSIDYVPIDSISANDYNPNRQSETDFELLCRSINEDGMTQPIVVLRKTNTIVDGEHRWRACRALGYKEVPVVFTDMSPAQARIATLRHNRARGDEDIQLAAAVLRDLAKLGATEHMAESLMMDQVEVDAFLKTLSIPDGFTTDETEKMVGASQDELRDMIKQEGGNAEEFDSVSVQDVVRAREDKNRAERKSQTADAKERDSDFYLMRLVYENDEGAIVREALGADPVGAILKIARETVGRSAV